MSGWIKLHRSLMEWEWYDDINVMRLFVHCLLRANHKEKKWRGMDIKRGQFYTSLDTLAKETGLSTMQLRTCFSKLESTGEITSLGMARGRMVTVVQYDEYQDDNKLDNRVATGLQQADNRVVTTNKNDNNIKKEIKLKDIVQPSVERVKEPDFITPAFNYFWDRYPRKTGKKKSFLKFKVLMKNKKEDGVRELTNKIAYDINFKLKTDAWNIIEKPEFIPHPLTYLNSEGWLDHE